MEIESDHWAEDVIACRRASPAGAEGIAQIIRRWHPTVDPCDPPAALAYAARWLDQLIQRYGGWPGGLAAYNWGPGNVAKVQAQYGDQWQAHLPAETARYITEIMGDETMPGANDMPTIGGMVLPVAGPLTQGFGHTDYDQAHPGLYGPLGHEGIDVGAAEGVMVRAVNPGRVTWAGWINRQGQQVNDGTGLGVCVMVDDGTGRQHRYGHLSALAVAAGNQVIRGTPLGYVGHTGAADGPHLHYEVRIGGVPTDPLAYLRSLADGPMPAAPDAWTRARVTATDGLRFRAEPNTTAQVIGSAPFGSVVEVLREWLPVRWQNRTGYMHADYLDLLADTGLQLTQEQRDTLHEAGAVLRTLGLID